MTGMPGLRSALPGLLWPALPEPYGRLLLALMQQLDQSQWWEPARLGQRQAPQLGALLRHAVEQVPFYARRYAGLPVQAIAADPLGRWRELPVVRRPQLQEAGDDLFARALPQGHGNARPGETSGSTGRPLRHLSSDVTMLMWMAMTLREHYWQRRDCSGTLAAIRPDRGGRDGSLALPDWGPPLSLLHASGPSLLLHSSTPVDDQLDWLHRQRPAVLLSLPSNLDALAEASLARGTELPGLREVRSYGEALRPGLRERVRDAWGVPLSDSYSAQEAGYLALQCPDHPHYHVQSENLWLEVLDPQGAPCPPGQVGEVVITCLHNFASPLIRYALGDYAEPGEDCPCGRRLPVLRRIAGRTRNMARLPDGRRFWPTFPARRFARIVPLRQLQLVQHAADAIEVRHVTDRDLDPGEQAQLTRELQDSLGYPFRVTFRRYDAALPGTAGGKFEDFICAITEP